LYNSQDEVSSQSFSFNDKGEKSSKCETHGEVAYPCNGELLLIRD